jgi:ABC-type phosphate/phosphonate transport system substrate-binding protein
MIASLPMYATPLTAGADARLWAAIRDRLRESRINAPENLSLGVTDLITHWLSPDLVLSQTCSLPYRSKLRDAVTLIGTPDYGLKGCPPGYYQSLVVARSNDPRRKIATFKGCRFAYNDPLSQSGWAAIALEMPELLNGHLLCTGSHLASARAVRHGLADIASLDAVTFRHLTRASEAGGLRIIHATQPTPGLPLIAAQGVDPLVVFDCVKAAIAGLSGDDRNVLGMRDIITLPGAAYDLPLPPTPQAVSA